MISKATMSRLPEYLEFVRTLPSQATSISATAISRTLGFGEVQVRKDLASVCGKGKPKTGYCLGDLTAALEAALGVHSQSEAVIVGAGKLGTALLGFSGFEEYGITIRCAFDSECDPDTERIHPIAAFPDYCTTHNVELGIICVPSPAAQEVADMMVGCGIKAIWCFAVYRLNVPEDVSVQYENMALSLAHLKSKLRYQGERRN